MSGSIPLPSGSIGSFTAFLVNIYIYYSLSLELQPRRLLVKINLLAVIYTKRIGGDKNVKSVSIQSVTSIKRRLINVQKE